MMTLVSSFRASRINGPATQINKPKVLNPLTAFLELLNMKVSTGNKRSLERIGIAGVIPQSLQLQTEVKLASLG